MLFSSWLELREPADAAARAPELVERVRTRLTGDARSVIHDLGCGTGSMGRWLAPQLDGPQHWVLYDRDAHLLELSAAAMAEKAADGSPVTVETRQRDVGTLASEDLAGAALVTASALLDILTAEEIGRVAAACAGAACPALLTLSVVGRVEFTDPEPFDIEVMAAFNEHQRRVVAGRRLAGPDAVDVALAAFGRLGVSTIVRPSPWRLGMDGADLMNADLMNVDLTTEWFVGWVAAACEQRPDLTEPAAAYARRRLAEVADGRVGVVVHHDDVLACA
jgi:hypothetical protein